MTKIEFYNSKIRYSYRDCQGLWWTFKRGRFL